MQSEDHIVAVLRALAEQDAELEASLQVEDRVREAFRKQAFRRKYAQRRWRNVPEFREMQHLSFREELHAIEAVIDGQVVPVVRVDGLVQGVPVPAGSHRVELAYRAPGLRTGFLITLGTLTAILLMAAVSALRATLRKRVVSMSGGPDTVPGTV